MMAMTTSNSMSVKPEEAARAEGRGGHTGTGSMCFAYPIPRTASNDDFLRGSGRSLGGLPVPVAGEGGVRRWFLETATPPSQDACIP